jgi:hypothetical protein
MDEEKGCNEGRRGMRNRGQVRQGHLSEGPLVGGHVRNRRDCFFRSMPPIFCRNVRGYIHRAAKLIMTIPGQNMVHVHRALTGTRNLSSKVHFTEFQVWQERAHPLLIGLRAQLAMGSCGVHYHPRLPSCGIAHPVSESMSLHGAVNVNRVHARFSLCLCLLQPQVAIVFEFGRWHEREWV